MSKKTNSGFTLMEMMIYTFLLSIVLAMIANFLYQAANFRVNQRIENTLFRNSQLVINKISQDIKKAEAVTNPVDENFTNTLSLQINGEEISYQVQNGIIKRNGTDLTDNQVELKLSAGDRGFRKIDSSIQIKFGLEAKHKPFGQSKKEKIYQTTVALSSQ